jgi:hypothetical protein
MQNINGITEKIVLLMTLVFISCGCSRFGHVKSPTSFLDQPSNRSLTGAKNDSVALDSPKSITNATSSEVCEALPSVHANNQKEYERCGDKIYYNHALIDGADPGSFTVLAYDHAKDLNRVYYQGKRVEGIDSATFEFMKDLHYAKDRVHVYFCMYQPCQMLEGLDAETYQILENKFYSKDKNAAYYTGRKIEGADPRSFSVLANKFSMDKSSVFFMTKKIESADPQSFSLIRDDYSKDAKYHYIGDKKIPGIDQDSFFFLNDYFAKDGARAYYCISDGCDAINGADAHTFKALSFAYAKDSNSVYYRNSLLPDASPETFVVLEDRYGKDGVNFLAGIGIMVLNPLHIMSFTETGMRLINATPNSIRKLMSNRQKNLAKDSGATDRAYFFLIFQSI